MKRIKKRERDRDRKKEREKKEDRKNQREKETEKVSILERWGVSRELKDWEKAREKAMCERENERERKN